MFQLWLVAENSGPSVIVSHKGTTLRLKLEVNGQLLSFRDLLYEVSTSNYVSIGI